ncbi:MAG: hypothetical protein NWF08_03965 [Candidatus Bathyarchaeota archaeon]|nr:hypothetical protein [Candidatus Bathyarchaeota archaeon]
MQKTRELANFILDKSRSINFSRLIPHLDRQDTRELREKILSLTVADARKNGINKSTLWYLQKRAKLEKPLRINQNIRHLLKFNNYP